MEYNSYPSWYTENLNKDQASPIHTTDPTKSGVTYRTPERRLQPNINSNNNSNNKNNNKSSNDQEQSDVLDMIELASAPLLNLVTPTRQSAQEPARILAALDKAATPLLETVKAMISVVDNQPLTDMLQKLFSFFDIVIRAARKSAGLYANVIQQQEIEQARTILNASMSNIGDNNFIRFEKLFHRLLDVSLESLKAERDHSNLLVFCHASSAATVATSTTDIGNTNGIAEGLVNNSTKRTEIGRKEYLNHINKLKQQLKLFKLNNENEDQEQDDEQEAEEQSGPFLLEQNTITISKDTMEQLQNDQNTMAQLQNELKVLQSQLDERLTFEKNNMHTLIETKELRNELNIVKEQREHAETQRDVAVNANRSLREELRELKVAIHSEPLPTSAQDNSTSVHSVHKGVAQLEKKVQIIEEEHKQRSTLQLTSPSSNSDSLIPMYRNRASSVLAAVQGALDVGQQSMNDTKKSGKKASPSSAAHRGINVALRSALRDKDVEMTALKNRTKDQATRFRTIQNRVQDLTLSKAKVEEELIQTQEKYQTEKKQWNRKSEMITHLQEIATNADRSRRKALDTIDEEKKRSKQIELEFGPDVEKLRQVHAQTVSSLERARASRSTLMAKIQSMEKEESEYNLMSSENIQMKERLLDAEAHDTQRNKLLSSLEKKLTVCRIQLRQHQQGMNFTTGGHSSPIGTPKKSPFVTALSPAATHNVKMMGARFSPSSIASPTSVAATAAATAAHAARELQRKLSAARNTISVLKQREVKTIAESKSKQEVHEKLQKEHSSEMCRIKQRLTRGEENLRKIRHTKILLEKKIDALEQEAVDHIQNHSVLQKKARSHKARSDKARNHMIKQLGEARAANATNDVLENTYESEESSARVLSGNNTADTAQELNDSKVPSQSVQEHVAASLVHALNKMKIGCTRNIHGRGTHVDLRGFQGGDMTKDIFVREIRGQLGVRLTHNEANILFFYFDADHGGSVSFTELLIKLQRPKDFLVMSDRDAMKIANTFLNPSGLNEQGQSSIEKNYVPDSIHRHHEKTHIINLDSVEQLRLKLKVACTTFKGVEPNRTFSKWDRNGDNDLSKSEVKSGISKLLGANVIEEWKMFDNFFDYVDLDGNGSISSDEFERFVLAKPTKKILKKRSEKHESSNNFFGSFAKASGSMSSTGRSPSRTYSAKRLKARAHTKIDDHQSRNLLQKAKGHHIDYVHERGAGNGSAYDAPDVKHAHSKVHDHQSAAMMNATHAHHTDYVHDRAAIELVNKRELLRNQFAERGYNLSEEDLDKVCESDRGQSLAERLKEMSSPTSSTVERIDPDTGITSYHKKADELVFG